MKLFYICIAAIVLSSCKKEEIKDPVTDSEPVFNAEIQLDGSSLKLEAGINDVFMSTFSESINGANKYSGQLGNEDQYLKIGIFQGDIDIQDPFSVKNFQGALHFAALPQGPLAILKKADFPNAAIIDHVIWYKDGLQEGFNELAIMEPGKYEICAEVHFIDGEEKVLCNQLILGFNLNGDCRIDHLQNTSGELHAWLEEPSFQIGGVQWFVDGQLVCSDNELITFIDKETHLVEAIVTFTNGSVRKRAILVDGSLTGHLIHDFTVVENSPSNQTRWDYGVIMELLVDGKQYTTLTANNQDSSIDITDIAYFGLNAQGKKVYKCVGNLSAIVKEIGTNNSIPVSISTTFGLEMD